MLTKARHKALEFLPGKAELTSNSSEKVVQLNSNWQRCQPFGTIDHWHASMDWRPNSSKGADKVRHGGPGRAKYVEGAGISIDKKNQSLPTLQLDVASPCNATGRGPGCEWV